MWYRTDGLSFVSYDKKRYDMQPMWYKTCDRKGFCPEWR